MSFLGTRRYESALERTSNRDVLIYKICRYADISSYAIYEVLPGTVCIKILKLARFKIGDVACIVQ